MAIPAIPDVRELMEAGVHFGHASGKWHPKMAPYIFCTRDKLHIIDLEKTQVQLKTVLTDLENFIRSGKTLMIVGTKRQVSPAVKEMAERLSIPYVSERWLGGTMTNFGQMMQSIQRMKKAEEILSSDEAAKMIKKERVMLQADLKRMHSKFGGLRDFTKKPDALFIIDPSYEHNAVKEARFEGIEIYAIVDTNSDPSVIDHVIPANDDGPKSLKLMLNLIEQTIAEGQKLISVSKEATATATDEDTLNEIEDTLATEEVTEKVAAKAAKEVRDSKKKAKDEEKTVETTVEK